MKTKSQIYKDSLDAWGRGDVQGMSAPYADDIEWYPNRSMRPVKGKTAMLEFMAKFGAGMSIWLYQPPTIRSGYGSLRARLAILDMPSFIADIS